MKICPFCAEQIQDAAVICRYCNADVVAGTRPQAAGVTAQPSTGVVVRHDAPSPGVAAVLSLVFPGAGQIYAGHTGSGLVWLFAVVLGYLMFIVPGLILHIICIVNAASTVRDSAALTAAAATERRSAQSMQGIVVDEGFKPKYDR